MPYDDPDPTDPSMLVGVMLPDAGDSWETMRAMAAVFAEEFARLGYAEHEIFRLFEDPFYAGPHTVLRALGIPTVLTVIQEAAERWPQVRILDKER